MGIFGKIVNKARDLFADEVEEEVPIKNLRDEPKPKIEPVPSLKQNVKVDEVSERDIFKADPTFKFPVVFDDKDFVEPKPKTPTVNVVDLEKNKPREIHQPVEKKPFKPSPVLSPIYGIIESEKKNDGTSKASSNQVKKPTIDDVIGRNYQHPESKPIASEIGNIGLRSTKVTIEETSERQETKDAKLGYTNINDLLENTSETDFYTLVDSMYKKMDEGEEE